jgi:hypothetical protein
MGMGCMAVAVAVMMAHMSSSLSRDESIGWTESRYEYLWITGSSDRARLAREIAHCQGTTVERDGRRRAHTKRQPLVRG